jgi:hypothetical protein
MSRDGVRFVVYVEDVHLFNLDLAVVSIKEELFDFLDDVSSFRGRKEQRHSIRTWYDAKSSGLTIQRSRGPLEFARTMMTPLAFTASSSYLMSMSSSEASGVALPLPDLRGDMGSPRSVESLWIDAGDSPLVLVLRGRK